MLQPSFHIEADNLGTQDFRLCRLLIVVDNNSISYVLLNTENMLPLCIKYFHFSQIQGRQQDEILREIIFGDEILTKDVNETFIVFNFPENTLVPDVFLKDGFDKEFTNLMYGNLDKGLVVSEKVPWWDMHSVYRLPLDVHKMMSYKFPDAKQWHYYSLLLKSYKKFNPSEKPETLHVIFYEERMIVSVYKKGQLQLLQNFLYSEPKDVLYHLLNCCQQLNINQHEVSLQLSGFIEKQSAIYRELMMYFSNVSFEEPDDSISRTGLFKAYPLHYFSPILKMAACV